MTRRTGPPEALIRFVLSPDGVVTPDVRRRLPGRGVWVDATANSVAAAVAKRAFARGFKAQVSVPATLDEDVATLLRRAALDRLALAHKAGLVTAGFEKVRARLASGAVAALVVARDGAPDGIGKVQALAKKAANLHNERNVVDLFTSAELERTLGRDRVVHAALSPGRLSELFILDAARLRSYAFGTTQDEPHSDQPDERTFAGPLNA
ncbi:RNA-binding protein [Acuticoccus sp.]|uniref:RNA-binding protein n=1 Tax=Acuticoccus sp. TaxID=1904378 RepID=UPI003B5209C2